MLTTSRKALIGGVGAHWRWRCLTLCLLPNNFVIGIITIAPNHTPSMQYISVSLYRKMINHALSEGIGRSAFDDQPVPQSV